MRTLLLPCAGLSSRYPGVRPKWMLTLPGGALALQRAVDSLAPDDYDRIVVAVRADHEALYGCRKLLRRAFGPSIETLVIERDTQGPADTVAHIVRWADVAGAIAIKDCDSFFDPAPLPDANFVSTVDVRSAPHLTNIAAKSFAVLDRAGNVADIVEKRVASDHICVGLYGFADVSVFLDHFAVAARAQGTAEIFVSHVLSSAMRDGAAVVRQSVTGYVDVGTLEDWQRHFGARAAASASV